MRGLVLGIAIGASACLRPDAVECAFGTCPAGTDCDTVHDRCVLADQLLSCQGRPDDEACMAGDKPGFCDRDVCVVKGCGDGRIDGLEQCDTPVFINDATDCLGIGYYQPGPISCNADCTIDTSQCHEHCGDGTKNGMELCDYAAASSDGSCTDAGYYSPGAVPCNLFCSYDYNAYCTGRCGDGMLNGPELCEPSTGAPSYLTCLDYGYDSGTLDCAATCNVELTSCHHFNLWPSGSTTGLFLDAWQASANEAFLVGSEQTTPLFMRWDGQSLTQLNVPAGGQLFGVSGTSPTDVMAVGLGGRIVHYKNGTFTDMSSGVTGDFTDVHMRTASDGWAVAGLGQLTHYNGTAWTAMASGTSRHLLAVWGTSANDAWAVGDRGVIVHYNGSWSVSSAADTLTSAQLYGVWASGPNDVWAVGDQGTIAHYNGTWSKFILDPAVRWQSVWGTASDDVIAVGFDSQLQGALAYYDGTEWTVLQRMTDGQRTITGVDRSHALSLHTGGRVSRWEGIGRTDLMQAPQVSVAVWGLSRDDLFLGTGNGVYRRTGSTWTQVTTVPAGAIWGTSTSDVFVAGTQMLHYNGTSWTPMTMPPEYSGCNGIWGSSGSNVYVVCDSGYVFRYNGSTWSLATTLGTDLGAVWGTSATNIYAAGTGGLYHFNGTTWTTIEENSPNGYLALWGSAANDVYAVGVTGLVRHFDGSAWTTVTVPTTRTLRTITGTASNDIFAAGPNILLHFDGTTWAPVAATVTNTFAMWTDARATLLFEYSGGFRQIVRACPTCL